MSKSRTAVYKRALPTDEVQKTRYVVGIDLGTTNTALAYVDRRAGRQARAVQPFEVAQLTEPGILQARRTLPSAVYLPAEAELAPAQLALPWRAEPGPEVVGTLARVRGALTPGRLITSAKSWLCHPGVDRHGQILPWGAGDEIPRRSPVEVEATILQHLQSAWDHHVEGEPGRRLAEQDVVVTIPASFDEVARELTVEACQRAGLEDALLIEEPQAALYAWIAAHEDTWEQELTVGQMILVCDVGGGTTDFSLIRVIDDEGLPGFERVAVGDHLLLGGDNMDLTLARRAEQRIKQELDLRQWHGLVQACREAKEQILEGERKTAQVAVVGRGRKLIGGTLRTQITLDEVQEVILEGFFPRVGPDEPTRRPGGGAGLKEFGLPYETEPAITRHLRWFLAHHGHDGALVHVDHVLFNGGVFRTAQLRERVLDVLGTWQERPHELLGSDLDLAVAHGAAYYGLVRRGKGTRIKSGAGRSYYVEIGGTAERSALCLIPRGLPEGNVVTIADHPLELHANRPVVFPFHSATNRDDAAGAMVKLSGEGFTELPPLHTVVRVGKKRTAKIKSVPVELVARYTELGTLEMWAQSKEAEDKRWRLELDTRPRQPSEPAGAGGEEAATAAPDGELPPEEAAGVDPGALDRARKHLITTLRLPAGQAQKPLEKLGKELEELLGGAREGWPVPVIRTLFDVLHDERAARKRSPDHEARWTNLAGFLLRPGFGSTLDFGRVNAMWKIYLEGMQHPNKDAVRLEWTVAYRRIAGGFARGQQETLFSPFEAILLGNKGGASKQMQAELWRLAASLEHLSAKRKKKLGNHLLDLIEKGKAPPRWGPWAMGRLGARAPLYGPLDRLVSAEVAAGWLRRILDLKLKGGEAIFSLVQLARLTGDRARDVPNELRLEAHAQLRRQKVDARTLRPLEEVVQSELRDQAEYYGDSVPIGLVLQSEA